jgi:predicted alpha-1,2-mannosidase
VDVVNKGKDALYAQVRLDNAASVVNLKTGVSLKSVDNAQKFLREQLDNQSFEQIKARAKQIWDERLSSIKIEGGTADEQRLFYTTLYHSLVMPRDRTGDNPHWNSNLPHLDDHYCIWDTWRTKYPLMILINESFVVNSINSFIDRFEHLGMCHPTFTSSLDWSERQGGDDVDNVIADAFVKGVQGFDRTKAYELMKWNARNERSKEYLRLGWQPEVGAPMSCSYNAEFAYNDYCASVVADIMGDAATAKELKARAESWKMLYNNELESKGFKGFFAPRKEDGKWINIDPAKWYASWVEYFYEGNSWTYTLFVPHQIDTLIALCGGKEEMVRRLAFGFDNHLITLGNEPGFLSPFIFTHCNRPDLTAKYIAELRKSEFSLSGGYSDNDDSGALGAWYVFTSIGLFPNAGQDLYYLIPPAFDKIDLQMENGKTIHIRVANAGEGNRYIKSVTLNGTLLDRTWVRHSEISNGADIVFTLINESL